MRCRACSIWEDMLRTASRRSPMPCPYFFVSCLRLDSCKYSQNVDVPLDGWRGETLSVSKGGGGVTS